MSLAFSPDAKTLAFTRSGQTITLVETATGKEIGKLTKEQMVGEYLGFFQRRHQALLEFQLFGGFSFPSYASKVMEWDIATRKFLRTCAMPYALGEYPISLSPDGNTLVMGSGGPTFLRLE